jgi:hypothetical protein
MCRGPVVDPPAHVHQSGNLLLLVDSGGVEVELDGHDVVALLRDDWMYLPAGVPHRVAILDDARVTLHVSGGEPCPELRLSGISSPLELDETPIWVRQPARVAGPECDRSPLGRSWAGRDAIDCGLVGREGSDSGYRCAMWAQEHHRAFFLVEDLVGIDSPVSDVLVRTAAGTSFEISLSGYNTYTSLWRACARFEGPSWRGRRLRGSPACVPQAIDRNAIQRFTGEAGQWNCSAGAPSPEIPARAEEAADVLRRPGAASGLFWPTAAMESLGRGALDFVVIEPTGEARCLGDERTKQPEVWFLSDAWNAHRPEGISIPADGDRTFPLRAFSGERRSVVYRAHSDRPWPQIFEKCPEIIRSPGKRR